VVWAKAPLASMSAIRVRANANWLEDLKVRMGHHPSRTKSFLR
jgi:hypothetical protein